MHIWLINPYGPIPTESWRDYSFTMMADALTRAGHDVVWWTSNFSHHFKRFRSSGWLDMQINEHFIVRMVPTPGYKRNVGLGRIIRDSVFSFRTYMRGKKSAAPDCIVYYESPLTLGYAGFKLAKYHNCPVIYDQMDLWPELIEQVFPKFLQPFISLLFAPIYKNRKKVYRQLDAVIGLAKPYLDVALNEAPVLSSRPHIVIYNGIDVTEFRTSMHEITLAAGEHPSKDVGEVWAVFAGSLGPSYDIPALLQVAEKLEYRASKLRIIIAGDGPLRALVESYVADSNHKHLYYVGKLAPEKLAALYKICDIGLCAYSKRSNVEMPDKIYDYIAAGLPVVNSLRGEVSQVVRDSNLGLQYMAEDPDDLLEKLELLADNRPLREEMSKNSFAAGMVYDCHLQYAKLVCIVEQVSAAGRKEGLRTV
jgi:glycosyltransferase involved in cell wall biosynthesis